MYPHSSVSPDHAILSVFALEGLDELLVRRILQALEVAHAGERAGGVLRPDAFETPPPKRPSESRVWFEPLMPAAVSCLKKATLLPPTTQLRMTSGFAALILLISEENSIWPSG